MERDYKKLISRMTLEEKAQMCSGLDFWHLKSYDHLGIPQVRVSDGPHGLRKTLRDGGGQESIPAVCFPAACATACSFDRELLYELGETLGRECQAEDVSVLLGPAVNMKRSPLCGRNFEYFSEDPCLAGELAASYIQGVQSQGVGTSIKHFAANNQEFRRMSGSAEVSERALREIYLPAFETAVKRAKPWTVMCSYNRVNGTFASENRRLLTEILREEWGFEGYVMSDWGAVNDRVKGLLAGLDLEMPGSHGTNDAPIVEAVRSGELPEEVLDQTVERLLRQIFRYADAKRGGTLDLEGDHARARAYARECMVLLKNRDSLLPLAPDKEGVAFLGAFAETPRYQGGGSSHINSFKVVGALEAARQYAPVSYAQGFRLDRDIRDDQLFQEAVDLAKKSRVAVLFVGLPDDFESEGYDRRHMRLPDCQTELIEAVCAVQPRTVVVLHNGSPVEMPWADSVGAILEAYLCGQAAGEAEADLLFGAANPCGKLAETFPLRLQDTPSYLEFPGDGQKMRYSEDIYIGYRFYDAREMGVLFPFGHGLSYTSFEYSNLRLSREKLSGEEKLLVSVDVKNTGTVPGKEIVQLYVSDRTDTPRRPLKELKGFQKLSLRPGETGTAVMELTLRDFCWYDEERAGWTCVPGEYRLLVGKSSRNIVLSAPVTVDPGEAPLLPVTENTVCGDILREPRRAPILMESLKPFLAGNDGAPDQGHLSMVENLPLRGARSFAGMTNEQVRELVEKLNRVN